MNRFDSSITSSQPAVGTIAAVCRRSRPLRLRPRGSPERRAISGAEQAAQQRQRATHGDQGAEAGARRISVTITAR